MKRVYLFILSFLILHQSYGQAKKLNLSDSTSNIIDKLSYFWIKDSLANNGFRLYSYERILKSKIDDVSVSELLNKLGKPNRIQEHNKGIDYWYYYYDEKAMPNVKHPFECGTIHFTYSKSGKLVSIGQTVLDY